MVGVVLAIPPAQIQISADLGASFSQLQWLLNGYLLAQAAVVVSAGSLGDRFGHCRLFVAGTTCCAFALLACAAAPTATLLDIAAVVAGLGCGVALGNMLSLITLSFDGARRQRALSIWGVMIVCAYAVGPLIGGIATQLFSWRATFVVLAVLTFVSGLLAIYSRVGRFHRDDLRSIDVVGVILASGVLAGGCFVLIEGNQLGWGGPPILIVAAVAACLLVAFLSHEARCADPMLDLLVLRNRVVVGTTLGTLTLSMGFFALTFYGIGFLRRVGDLGPTAAAVYLLGATGTAVLAAIVGLRLRDRVPKRTLISAALLCMGLGMAGLASLDAHSRPADLLPNLMVFGVGLGLINGPLAAAVSEIGKSRDDGVLNGLVYMCRPIGGAIGIAGLGLIFEAAIGVRIDGRAAAEAVARGDLHSALAASPRAPGSEAARAAFASASTDVFLAAATVSVLGAVLTRWLLREPWQRLDY